MEDKENKIPIEFGFKGQGHTYMFCHYLNVLYMYFFLRESYFSGISADA